MHNIEPFYNWRDYYAAEEDEYSPFFGRQYSEFMFNKTIYNYCIHPQWDYIGSPTIYSKILYADYINGFSIIELIGEWNDCINNDIMFLKREIIDSMIRNGINKFIIIGENVLNFHASDDCYYEEWWQDVSDEGGWITAINMRDHITDEMIAGNLHFYMSFGESFNNINWRIYKPLHFFNFIENRLFKKQIAQ